VEVYLRDRLTFPNPKYLENEKFNYWQGDTPAKLSYYHRTVDGCLLPRGFASQLIKTLDHYRLKCRVEDLTRLLPEVDFSFRGDLRPYQEEAVKAILGRKFGVLEAPPGAGKTIIALAAVAIREQPALILTHTKELLYQWQDRAVQFLGLQKDEIRLIGDGKKKIGNKLTIGIVNSVWKPPRGGTVSPWLLVTGKNTCRELARMVSSQRPTRELYGDVRSAQRKRIVAELNRGKIKVLVATSQLIGEGFDLPALSNLFLTTPIKFDGRVKQYAGRVLRTAKGKKPPTIYDYVDRPGVLEASFKARKRAYAEMGIEC